MNQRGGGCHKVVALRSDRRLRAPESREVARALCDTVTYCDPNVAWWGTRTPDNTHRPCILNAEKMGRRRRNLTYKMPKLGKKPRSTYMEVCRKRGRRPRGRRQPCRSLPIWVASQAPPRPLAEEEFATAMVFESRRLVEGPRES